ncbi:MAG: hypothetical protein QOF78_2361 [Phycisphaerales bacterium]|jgi:hypothetical protein|nr:hypothetical protein [Phycisphaerales bacterium]
MKVFGIIVVLALAGSVFAQPKLLVEDVGEAFDGKHVEFRGVAAGEFDPRIWEKNAPHFVPDVRAPLLEPRPGNFRNIYAPSIVPHGGGWRIFYGGWDGVASGNDRIYAADVDRDFLRITDRRTVIEHGVFQHVCNVSVVAAAGGRGRGLAMACTAYPDAKGLNKTVTFFSEDGEKWNTAAARQEDFISMTGYAPFAAADINGMNVLLREGDAFRLYFNNFQDGNKTFRASSGDGRGFTFDGVVLQPSALVNDVKKLKTAAGDDWFLMALHMNTDRLFYSLSRDGMKFPEAKTLATSGGDADKFIVSIGWIVADGRVLGFLYGAGSEPSLDRNRIFARWLQKKVTIDAPGVAEARALGPDRQILPLTAAVTAAIELRDEGGNLMATSAPVELKPGRAYALKLPQTPAIPSAAEREATPR